MSAELIIIKYARTAVSTSQHYDACRHKVTKDATGHSCVYVDIKKCGQCL